MGSLPHGGGFTWEQNRRSEMPAGRDAMGLKVLSGLPDQSKERHDGEVENHERSRQIDAGQQW